MCSSMLIKSMQGGYFWGRTMDFAASMFHDQEAGGHIPSQIISIPANITVPAQSGEWESRYATVGVGTAGNTILYDGINECGLTGDLQVLMECSYADADSLQSRGLKGILGEEVVTNVLTTCKDVSDVREFAKTHGLINKKYDDGGDGTSIPAHYAFIDETGAGVVLEPTDHGAFKVYDYIGAMTNSPEYDYHTTNLRNYISLDNLNRSHATQVGDTEIKPIEAGTGYGMFGLPGDFTSPSRFVRAMFVKNNIDAFNDDEGITTLYNCFKTVMIPKGLSRTPEATAVTDYTQYWTGYDLSKRTMYLQDSTCLTMTVKQIDPSLSKITFQDINLTPVVHEI